MLFLFSVESENEKDKDKESGIVDIKIENIKKKIWGGESKLGFTLTSQRGGEDKDFKKIRNSETSRDLSCKTKVIIKP